MNIEKNILKDLQYIQKVQRPQGQSWTVPNLDPVFLVLTDKEQVSLPGKVVPDWHQVCTLV